MGIIIIHTDTVYFALYDISMTPVSRLVRHACSASNSHILYEHVALVTDKQTVKSD